MESNILIKSFKEFEILFAKKNKYFAKEILEVYKITNDFSQYNNREITNNYFSRTRPNTLEIELIEDFLIFFYDSIVDKEKLLQFSTSEQLDEFYCYILPDLPVTTKVLDHIGVEKISAYWKKKWFGNYNHTPIFRNIMFSKSLFGDKYKNIISDKSNYFKLGLFPIDYEIYILEKENISFDIFCNENNIIWTIDLLKELIKDLRISCTRWENKSEIILKKEISDLLSKIKGCPWSIEWLIELSFQVNISQILYGTNIIGYTSDDVVRLKDKLVELDIFDICSHLYVNDRRTFEKTIQLDWPLSNLSKVSHLIKWDLNYNFEITPEIFYEFYSKFNFKKISATSIVNNEDIFDANLDKWNWDNLGYNFNFKLDHRHLDYLVHHLNYLKFPNSLHTKIQKLKWDEQLVIKYKEVLIRSDIFKNILQLEIEFSEDFIIQNEDYFTWKGQSLGQKRNSDTYDNYWHSAPTSKNKYLQLPISIIQKHIADWEWESMYYGGNSFWDEHDGGAWLQYSYNKHITLDHLRCFKEKLNWDIITKDNKFIQFNFDIVNEFKDYIAWEYIFERKELVWTTQNLLQYLNYINWKSVAKHSDILKLIKESSLLSATLLVISSLKK